MTTPSAAVGQVIGGLIAAVARVRPAAKPMHPTGEVLIGHLLRHGSAPRTGAAFLDEPGEDEVLLRFSRSVGLPSPLPDVNGLAIRVPTADGGHADVLMSGTGRSRVGRYLLAPALRPRGPFVGTLLPFRSPSGPVHVAAAPCGVEDEDGDWQLLHASPGSGWHHFATLSLTGRPGQDVDVSFDATPGAPDGLEVYEWHRRLRAPSYAAARRARGLPR